MDAGPTLGIAYHPAIGQSKPIELSQMPSPPDEDPSTDGSETCETTDPEEIEEGSEIEQVPEESED